MGPDSIEINGRAFQRECDAGTQARRHESGEGRMVGRYRMYQKETRVVTWKTKFEKVSAKLKNWISFSEQSELLKVYDEKNVMIDAHSYASNNKIKLLKSIYYHF